MKLLIVTIMLLFSSLLYSVNLTVEKVGETALIALKIESNELINKGNNIDYRAIFEVFDSEKKVAFLTKRDLKLDTSEVKNHRVILFFETDLIPAEYSAYLKLYSKLRNDKKEVKFEFVVEEAQQASNLYLVKRVNNVNIEVLSWDEVEEDSDIYLFQLYQEEVDNLKFVSESAEERSVKDLESTDKLNYKIELAELVPNFTNNFVEYLLQNKIYQTELKVEKQLNSFQQKYSWDEQLEQIKYIVNDKTWKEINRNSNMSKADKVLRFWDNNRSKDSSHNELQDIFYNRVLYADQKYSVHRYKKGWETDRGRIYIKFGEPDETSVDNHPVGKYPTQTWYYYHLNKTFIFYDRSRIEDYKLYNKEEEYGY